jgi:hypothetical protein
MCPVTAELERITKALGCGVAPSFERRGFGEAIERRVQLHSVEVLRIVSKPRRLWERVQNGGQLLMSQPGFDVWWFCKAVMSAPEW